MEPSEEYRKVRRFRLILWVGVIILLLATFIVTIWVVAHTPSDSLALETRRADSVNNQARQEVDEARLALSSAERELSNEASKIVADSRVLDSLRQSIDTKRKSLTDKEERVRSARTAYDEAQRNQSAAEKTFWVPYAIAGLVALTIIAVAFIVTRFYVAEKRRQWENVSLLTQIDSQDADQDDDSLDFESLWSTNRRQLRNYHKLVLNYAESTRQTTQISLFVGFLFLVAVSTLALFASDLASAIASSVVVSAGAVVTGFIARAILRNSETSSRELASFFSHPLEVERALAAERLIRTMPDAEQSGAKLVVVHYSTRTDPSQAAAPAPSEADRPSE